MNIIEMAQQELIYGLDAHGIIDDGDQRLRRIDQDSKFAGTLVLGREVECQASAVGPHVTLGHGSILGSARVGRDAMIHDRVRLGQGSVVFDDATVRDGVRLEAGAIIGPKVTVPVEAQIGASMIIPSTDSILTMGPFGRYKRTMTIHGSTIGPRYSVGCQRSIEWETLRHRITNAVSTNDESAAYYARYLEVFPAIGQCVQDAFNEHEDVVNDLRDEATWHKERTHLTVPV